MGKLAKLKKLEKAKVKLKPKKLPKGQNVTDTSFKVKKIVIRDQLKSRVEGELKTRRNVKVKELLSHLKHHNINIRQEGISGLRELVISQTDDVLKLHLPELIDGVSQLMLDPEKVVRRNALKLIETVLLKITPEQVVPLFDILQCYMICGMTHLNPCVQDDSLLLLDCLLEVSPSLVANEVDKILPTFFNMISSLKSESRPDRMLSANLNRKITSVQWRIKVLSRLNKLQDAVVREQKEHMKKVSSPNTMNHWSYGQSRTVRWTEQQLLYASVFLEYKNGSFSLLEEESHKVQSQEERMKDYVQGLMPLLFETWVEVKPDHSKDVNLLQDETALVLYCVCNIILKLWEYVKICEAEMQTDKLTTWLRDKYKDDIVKHFLPGFPYATGEQESGSVQNRKRKCNQATKTEKLLFKDCIIATGSCVQQNLTLCYLFFCFHSRNNSLLVHKSVSYIKQCLISSFEEVHLPHLDFVLRAFLLQNTRSWHKALSLITPVVKCQIETSNTKLGRMLFHILCDVILYESRTNQLRCCELEEWFAMLPNVLCKGTLSLKTLKALIQLASQNIPIFLKSLQTHLEDIIYSLPTIKFVGVADELEGQKAILDILYRVSDLEPNIFNSMLSHPALVEQKNLRFYVEEMKMLKELSPIL